MAKGTQANASLDNLLNAGAAQPGSVVDTLVAKVIETPAVEPTLDEVAANATVASTNEHKVVVVGDRHYRVVRTKTSDEIIINADSEYASKVVPRKFKSFRVEAVGNASKAALGELPYVVEGCLDASEAKQVLYVCRGLGASPARFSVKVSLAA